MRTPTQIYADLVADVDSRTLRSEYADAIEATDPERAELIRLQLRHRDSIDTRIRQSHFLRHIEVQRMSALQDKIRKQLRPEVPSIVNTFYPLRGFVEYISIAADAFLECGSQLWQRYPIQQILVQNADDRLAEILQSPLLDQLRGFVIGGKIGDEGAIRVANSPHLRQVELLGMSSADVGMKGLEALAATSNLPNLWYLGFGGNRVDFRPDVGWDWGSTAALDVRRSPVATSLIEQYGHRPWLDPLPYTQHPYGPLSFADLSFDVGASEAHH